VGKRVYEVGEKVDMSLVASFDILNLAPEKSATDYDGTLGVDEPEGESTVYCVTSACFEFKGDNFQTDFWSVRKIAKKRPLASSYLSVLLSVWNNLAPTGRIS